MGWKHISRHNWNHWLTFELSARPWNLITRRLDNDDSRWCDRKILDIHHNKNEVTFNSNWTSSRSILKIKFFHFLIVKYEFFRGSIIGVFHREIPASQMKNNRERDKCADEIRQVFNLGYSKFVSQRQTSWTVVRFHEYSRSRLILSRMHKYVYMWDIDRISIMPAKFYLLWINYLWSWTVRSRSTLVSILCVLFVDLLIRKFALESSNIRRYRLKNYCYYFFFI